MDTKSQQMLTMKLHMMHTAQLHRRKKMFFERFYSSYVFIIKKMLVQM